MSHSLEEINTFLTERLTALTANGLLHESSYVEDLMLFDEDRGLTLSPIVHADGTLGLTQL